MQSDYVLNVALPAPGGGNYEVLLLDCLDKRFSVVRPAAEWVLDIMGKRPYCLTKEGPASRLSRPLTEESSYVRSIKFVLDEAETEVIVVAAHQDCKGNRVEDEVQIQQLGEAVANLREFGFEGRIITLFMYDVGYNHWQVRPIYDSESTFACG